MGISNILDIFWPFLCSTLSTNFFATVVFDAIGCRTVTKASFIQLKNIVALWHHHGDRCCAYLEPSTRTINKMVSFRLWIQIFRLMKYIVLLRMPLGSVLKMDSNPFFSPAAAKSFSIKNDEIMNIAKNTNIFTNVFNTRLKILLFILLFICLWKQNHQPISYLDANAIFALAGLKTEDSKNEIEKTKNPILENNLESFEKFR